MALAADGPPPVTERGDALALRRSTDELLAMFAAGDPETPKVARQDHQIEVADGSTILARWYTKAGSNPGSAIVYYHGGGLVAGTVDNYDGLVTQYVQATGVPFLSVEYRLAPEVTGSTLVEDGHTALAWLVERAAEFGVEPERIAVMGDSGGGCIAAGVASTGWHQTPPSPRLRGRTAIAPSPRCNRGPGSQSRQTLVGSVWVGAG